MSHIIIQVYEIQDPCEAEKLVELGVDHIGSVLVSKENWRNDAIRDVVRVAQAGGAKSSIIPLFSEYDTIAKVLDFYKPNILHFCEMLPPNENGELYRKELYRLQAKIRKNFPTTLQMRSIPIPIWDNCIDFPVLDIAYEFETVSDIFLTDTFVGCGNIEEVQPVKGFVGITGKICNWNMVSMVAKHCTIPIILAGGLSPENVRKAILHVKPWGVDTCTGTNMVDQYGNPVRFRKDMQKLRAFINEVRLAESELIAKNT